MPITPDQLGLGQVVAGLGLEHVGARAFAAVEQACIDLLLLLVHIALHLGQGNLVFGEQRIHIGLRHAHCHFVGACLERLRALAVLHLALAVAHEGVQVQDRLA